MRDNPNFKKKDMALKGRELSDFIMRSLLVGKIWGEG